MRHLLRHSRSVHGVLGVAIAHVADIALAVARGGTVAVVGVGTVGVFGVVGAIVAANLPLDVAVLTWNIPSAGLDPPQYPTLPPFSFVCSFGVVGCLGYCLSYCPSH